MNLMKTILIQKRIKSQKKLWYVNIPVQLWLHTETHQPEDTAKITEHKWEPSTI